MRPPARLVSLLAKRREFSSLLIALTLTALYAGFVLLRLGATGRDPSFFLIASWPFTDAGATPQRLQMFPPNTGYDGQFFYRLAHDPWATDSTAVGVTFDSPAYRQSRIMYPLVARALTLGSLQHVPRALIAANLLAVGVLAYAAATFAATVGRSVLVSLLVPFYPGYLSTISRDLSELTEAALLVAAIALIARRHYWLAGLALTAGLLTKETALGVPIAGLLVWTIRRLRKDKEPGAPIAVWLGPLAAYAVWYALVMLRWGAGQLSRATTNFGPPLAGLLQGVEQLRQFRADWPIDIAVAALVLFTIGAVVVTYRHRLLDARVLPFACLLYAAVAPLYGNLIWEDEYAFPRALHEAFVMGVLALVAVNKWMPRFLAVSTLIVWWGWAVDRYSYP